MSLNWNFQRGGPWRVLTTGGVWIFSGKTHFRLSPLLQTLFKGCRGVKCEVLGAVF